MVGSHTPWLCSWPVPNLCTPGGHQVTPLCPWRGRPSTPPRSVPRLRMKQEVGEKPPGVEAALCPPLSGPLDRGPSSRGQLGGGAGTALPGTSQAALECSGRPCHEGDGRGWGLCGPRWPHPQDRPPHCALIKVSGGPPATAKSRHPGCPQASSDGGGVRWSPGEGSPWPPGVTWRSFRELGDHGAEV